MKTRLRSIGGMPAHVVDRQDHLVVGRSHPRVTVVGVTDRVVDEVANEAFVRGVAADAARRDGLLSIRRSRPEARSREASASTMSSRSISERRMPGALVDAGQEQQILDQPLESKVLREHDFREFLNV